jgi:hypothetical protein
MSVTPLSAAADELRKRLDQWAEHAGGNCRAASEVLACETIKIHRFTSPHEVC